MASIKPKLSIIKNTAMPNKQADFRVPHNKPIANPEDHPQYIESLYNTYRQSLLGYLMRLLPGGLQDANEILQETYIRLLRQDKLNHLEQNAKAYIFTIATNLARDSLRRQTSRRHDQHIPFDEMCYPSDELSPPQTVDYESSLLLLKKALFTLNPLTRRIFLLSRFEQMTYPEISNTLHISTRTVERHMSTAIKKLQIILKGLL